MNNREFIESITLEGEEWRDVIGYEGLYMVSSFGRIFSKMKNRLLSPCKNSSKMPHLYIDARKNGCRTKLYIHRLVALAFIPNPENKPCIDHINTIRHDNRIENLRWATYKENGNNEITKINLSNSQKGKPKNGLRNPVIKLNKNGDFIKEYASMTDAAIDTNGKRELSSKISSCCNKKRKTAGGFKWMHKEEYESMNNPRT